MGTKRILLISTYEMGHQPLGLAAAAAPLRAAGHKVECCDLSVERLDEDTVRGADMVAVSVPMHTAARLGVQVAKRVRKLNPTAFIVFYGLYATPLSDLLLRSGVADCTLGGEYEPALLEVASRGAERVSRSRSDFGRQTYCIPDRSGLPPLERYSHLAIGGELRLAGYVEASRGCAHTCTHCPITPVYGGRLRLVQPETVLTDIDQQVAMGARHITFGDPDFLNAMPHSQAIVDELHRRHPGLTFDATIKVEHLVEHEALLPRLRDAGCLFITSAFESTNDAILKRLKKGHTRADIERVVALCERERIAIRPTWVAFTPWTAAADYLDLLRFVEAQGLVGNVQPVQYVLRLLLPPGSPLVDVLERQARLDGFDEEALTYQWSNTDPRMDALQQEVSRIVGAAQTEHDGTAREPVEVTFARVKEAAYQALGIRVVPAGPVRPARVVPGLTESWFC